MTRVKVWDVIEVVAAEYGMTPRDLLGPSRAGRVVEVRQIAMLLSRRLTTASLPSIGQRMSRDHTTIIAGLRSITAKARTKPGIETAISELTQRVLSNALARDMRTELFAHFNGPEQSP